MRDIDIPTAWLRGFLDVCLLGLLRQGEAYGYELMGRLDDHGIGAVPGGSLYPALLRLEKRGDVASEWRAGDGGPGRKYYALTAQGRATLQHDVRAWRAFSGTVDALLSGTGHEVATR
jgi:PadR family transcriptional regulator, regulatory protein PadR